MSKSFYALFVLLVLACSSSSWAVNNAVVGTCRTGTSYTTIQSAIDAADAGSTVQICPGTYPEVLTISKNLTVKGVNLGTAASVVILAPSTGVPANGLSGIWGTLDVQVAIKNVTVNLSNVTIDGGGATTCPNSTDTIVGVMFQGASAGGSMTNSVVRNLPQGCSASLAAFIDASSKFNFSNNNLRDCSNVCLEIDFDADNTIVKNNVITATIQTNIAIDTQSLNGPTTISGNFIGGNVAYGIAVQTSSGVTVTGNNSSISSAFSGAAFVLWGATQSVVENNHGFGYYGVLVNDKGSTGGNIVTKNTLMSGYCGVATFKANTGDTTTGNTVVDMTSTACYAG